MNKKVVNLSSKDIRQAVCKAWRSWSPMPLDPPVVYLFMFVSIKSIPVRLGLESQLIFLGSKTILHISQPVIIQR